MKLVRKLWLRVYLYFSGIVTCKHAARGLYYCPTCEDNKKQSPLQRGEHRRERFYRLRKELDALSS